MSIIKGACIPSELILLIARLTPVYASNCIGANRLPYSMKFYRFTMYGDFLCNNILMIRLFD